MGKLKVGDKTNFYNLMTRRKEQAKITKISKAKGRSSAHAKSKSGKQLRKFISN